MTGLAVLEQACDRDVLSGPELRHALGHAKRLSHDRQWQRKFDARHAGGFGRALENLCWGAPLQKCDRLEMRDDLESLLLWLDERGRMSRPGRPVDRGELVSLWLALEGAARARRAHTKADLSRCRNGVGTPLVERAWFIAFGERPPRRETFRKRLQRARKGPLADFRVWRRSPDGSPAKPRRPR